MSLLALFFAITLGLAAADPPKDRLTYSIEWRLIHAGQAVLEYGASSASVKLESAGVVAKSTRYDGMIHGFFGMGAIVPAAKAAVDEAGAALHDALH